MTCNEAISSRSMEMLSANEPPARWRAFLRWIVPLPPHLCVVPRILVGTVGNAILAIYLAARINRMGDITSYPHLTANPRWVCTILGTPLVILLCMLPLFWSKRPAHRWAALLLSLFPFFFELVVGLSFLARGYN
jgi:hypothetical protein